LARRPAFKLFDLLSVGQARPKPFDLISAGQPGQLNKRKLNKRKLNKRQAQQAPSSIKR
jgi:hypothetical protein